MVIYDHKSVVSCRLRPAPESRHGGEWTTELRSTIVRAPGRVCRSALGRSSTGTWTGRGWDWGIGLADFVPARPSASPEVGRRFWCVLHLFSIVPISSFLPIRGLVVGAHPTMRHRQPSAACEYVASFRFSNGCVRVGLVIVSGVSETAFVEMPSLGHDNC